MEAELLNAGKRLILERPSKKKQITETTKMESRAFFMVNTLLSKIGIKSRDENLIASSCLDATAPGAI